MGNIALGSNESCRSYVVAANAFILLSFYLLSQKTGETYAIKVSNNFGMMRPVEIRRREYDVLLKLNHENIVKIFATEIEVNNASQHQL